MGVWVAGWLGWAGPGLAWPGLGGWPGLGLAGLGLAWLGHARNNGRTCIIMIWLYAFCIFGKRSRTEQIRVCTIPLHKQSWTTLQISCNKKLKNARTTVMRVIRILIGNGPHMCWRARRTRLLFNRFVGKAIQRNSDEAGWGKADGRPTSGEALQRNTGAPCANAHRGLAPDAGSQSECWRPMQRGQGRKALGLIMP